MIEPDDLARKLTETFGLSLKCERGVDNRQNEYYDFLPGDVSRSHGFVIRITLGWRSLQIEYLPGAYSAELIREMGAATDEEKFLFAQLVSQMVSQGGAVSMMVNGDDLDPLAPEKWPMEWKNFSLSLDKTPIAVNTENPKDTEAALIDWGGKFLASIMALAPLEEIEAANEDEIEGLPEGAKIKVEVNKYERSRFNRAACIEIHGSICKVCGFDFADKYGEIGKGFIHVHHIVPVSEIGENYKINPVKDLVPVCPNCHAMVHKRNPPLAIEEVAEILKRNKT